MLGQLSHLGTGSFDLFLNEKMLKNAVEVTMPDDQTGMAFLPQEPGATPMATPNYYDGRTPMYQYSPGGKTTLLLIHVVYVYTF